MWFKNNSNASSFNLLKKRYAKQHAHWTTLRKLYTASNDLIVHHSLQRCSSITTITSITSAVVIFLVSGYVSVTDKAKGHMMAHVPYSDTCSPIGYPDTHSPIGCPDTTHTNDGKTPFGSTCNSIG